MDLSGKGFSPAHSFLQNASSLVSAYGLGSSLVGGQLPLTTSIFAGTSHGLTSPIYSGSLSSSLSPSHTSFSNGHHISLNRHAEKQDSGASKSQIYSTPAPVFNRHKDSFPYGLSGVPMPNYNYHGDVYQFTSNGYPRKSRTCSYCGKVFTRSTTRRYHEKRCPLLRAAVSSYMGDESSGTAAAVAASSSRGRTAELTTHSYKSPSQGHSLSGINRSNETQEIATSILGKSPPGDRRTIGDSLLSGYQTSVIVKQEPHELEALANLASGNSSLNRKHLVQPQEVVDNVLRFSPGSEDSDKNYNRVDTSANLSPGYTEPGLDLTVNKSPNHTSVRNSENVHKSDTYISHYASRVNSREELHQDRRIIPPHLAPLHRDRYKIDLTKDDDDDVDDENEDDIVDDKDQDENEDDAGVKSESTDRKEESPVKRRKIEKEGGDAAAGETESVTSEKRDGKTYSSHKCGICGKTFENASKLHLHEQLHTKFKPYACKFCGQKFAKAAQRVEHEKTHNGMEVTHVCAVCGSSFTRKYSLKLHMRRWHQEGPWLCRHCGKASLTQMELKTHLYSHNLPRLERESLLYMPDIPHNYNATSTNSNEVEKKTYERKELPHDDGSSKINQEVGLQNVQEMEMCQECGRDFPKGYLRYHLKSHEAQKPYSCPICAKRFGYKNNMKSHIKLHSGIKPFQCKICGAKFTRGSTLRRHARRHGIIADSVWDLFVKPNYSKGGETGQSHNNKLNTLSTSRMDSNVSVGSQTTKGSCVGDVGDSNYLVTTISSTPPHGSLYPLYASLGQIPPHLSLYSGLSASTSYLAQHLPHSSIYAASSQRHPQQLDALNLSLHKGIMDTQSDQSSYSNISAERSRSRSRSPSGSDHRPILPSTNGGQTAFRDVGVQVHTCCSPKATLRQTRSDETLVTPSRVNEPVTGSSAQSTSPTPHLPTTPSPLAVVPYIVTSPSQRPSNVDSTSPALSVSSSKDYSMETISSLIGSGRMFKCFHCECYFAEYAMYRIHSKLHINDTTRPFVCMVCGEDCHDRVYFALHLAEHLR